MHTVESEVSWSGVGIFALTAFVIIDCVTMLLYLGEPNGPFVGNCCDSGITTV